MTHNSPDLIRLLVLRMLVLAGAVMAVFFLLTSADAEEPTPPPATHVVAAGDSLWNLAASVAPEGADLRRVVDHILELNGLDDATIYPGQRILLPAS
jgi:nucleoid-associated protein YgaU